MKKSIDDLFKETRIRPVEYEGFAVHRIVTRKVYKPGRFVIKFLRATEYPIQGLRINIDSGSLTIDDQMYKQVLLRLDVVHEEVLVTYRPSRNGSDIDFYNGWMYEDEVHPRLVQQFRHAGRRTREQADPAM